MINVICKVVQNSSDEEELLEVTAILTDPPQLNELEKDHKIWYCVDDDVLKSLEFRHTYHKQELLSIFKESSHLRFGTRYRIRIVGECIQTIIENGIKVEKYVVRGCYYEHGFSMIDTKIIENISGLTIMDFLPCEPRFLNLKPCDIVIVGSANGELAFEIEQLKDGDDKAYASWNPYAGNDKGRWNDC